jgi:hypothetical protein
LINPKLINEKPCVNVLYKCPQSGSLSQSVYSIAAKLKFVLQVEQLEQEVADLRQVLAYNAMLKVNISYYSSMISKASPFFGSFLGFPSSVLLNSDLCCFVCAEESKLYKGRL